MGKVHKIRFNGKQGQAFKLGTQSFAAGIWNEISSVDVKRLVEMGADGLFSFDPELPKPKVVKKTERDDAGEKKSKKEGKKSPKKKKSHKED